MVYVFLADGFEELEALTPVDVLRRAGIDTKTVGVTGKTVTGSHGIAVNCDIEVNDAEYNNLDAVILPGGLPGADFLDKSSRVHEFLNFAEEKGIIIAAICAAPAILGRRGTLEGKKAVCFTGFEKELKGATVVSEKAVRDGNIITACGAGAAFEFAFLILNALTGDDQSGDKMSRAMKYTI